MFYDQGKKSKRHLISWDVCVCEREREREGDVLPAAISSDHVREIKEMQK
jgi:hypothetical protein